MEYDIYQSAYTVAQIEASIGKTPIIQNGTWWLWNIGSSAYVNSGATAKGTDGAILYVAGSYSTLAELTAAYPSGDTSAYVVTATGYIYVWNESTSAWAAVGAASDGVYTSFANYRPPLENYYNGEDLTTKFATEIADYSDVWAWIKARCTANNFDGIFVKDYIPFTTTNSLTVKAQVADIDHDYRYMDTQVSTHHIDFISRDLWPTTVNWNLVNYNNGTSSQANPYLNSNVYAFVNSLSMSVPYAATVNPTTTTVDYTSGGIYYYLPSALQNVITARRSLTPSRYSSSGLLTDDNSWAWNALGNLWIPSEMEVYGTLAWATKSGWDVGTDHQFAIFRDGKNRIKGLGNGGSRNAWWLRSVYSGISTYAAFVSSYGNANNNAASAALGVPVCFRIAA